MSFIDVGLPDQYLLLDHWHYLSRARINAVLRREPKQNLVTGSIFYIASRLFFKRLMRIADTQYKGLKDFVLDHKH